MAIYFVTIGFAPARILSNSLQQVYNTVGLKPDRHIVLDNGYPKNKFDNSHLIHTECRERGIEYYNLGENLGLGAGYRWLIEKTNAKDDDIIIGVDPDVFPITQGWGKALVDVMGLEPRMGWLSLNVVPHTAREMSERGGKQSIIGDYVIQECPAATLNSICCWRPAMLRDVGGIHEPRKYYGGVESHMRPKLDLHKWRWAHIMDFKEEWHESVKCEEDYAQYKRDYVHGKTKDDFETWLKEKETK